MKNIKIKFTIFSILLIVTGILKADDTFELAAEIKNLKQNDPYIISRLNIKDDTIKALLDSVQNSKLLAESTESKKLKQFMFGCFSPEAIGKEFTKKSLVAVTEKQAPKLHAVIQSIADKLKMSKPFVFIAFDKNLVNALAFSLSSQASFILIGEQLLNTMNDEQIGAILSHELGHVYHNHTLKRLGLTLLLGVSGVLTVAWLLILYEDIWNVWTTKDKDFVNHLSKFQKFVNNLSKSQKIVVFSVLITALLSVTLLAPLTPAYLRSQEREADDIAIKIAGANAFTGSMESLKNHYVTKLEEFKKEYEFLKQNIEELEKFEPKSAAELKKSANEYNALIEGFYKGIIETGASTHPAMNERIETGKNAQTQEIKAEAVV